MTPEKLDRILAAVDNEGLAALHRMAAGRGPLDGSDLDADFAGATKDILDCRADLTAMRTPITIENLLDDGWEEPEEGFNPDVYSKDISGWSFRVDLSWRQRVWCEKARDTDDEWDSGEDFSVGLPGNMYDLSELVRLLGGAQ